MDVADNNRSISLFVSEDDGSQVAQSIHEILRDEVEREVGPSNRKQIQVTAVNESGSLVGGLKGFSHWKWLYISHLWVNESFRSIGIGAQLLARLESEAKTRGMAGIYVDTFNERARGFYLKNGFTLVGEIEGFPPGFRRTYLSKKI